MDPNIQAILLGLLTNGLTSFIAQFGRKDSKLILGRELLQKIKWEETALQPILQNAAKAVAESIEWHGFPTMEIVCLFLTSPEAEAIVRQIYAAKLTSKGQEGNLATIQHEFLTSFYLYASSYSAYAELKEEQLIDSSKLLFDNLIEGCEQALNTAIDRGNLSAHEAKSAFRHRLLLDELAALHENLTFLTSQQKPNIRDILAFEEVYRRQVGNRHRYITPPSFGKIRKLHINKLYVSPNFIASPKETSEKRATIDLQEALESHPYLKTLSKTFHAVLLGNPGGGKSTFTHKLCYELTTHYSERIYGGRQGLTPILIVLRDYGAEKKIHNYSLLEFIKIKAKADYQLQIPPGAFEYLLLNGRAMVIFDGLDELLDTHDRQQISSDVESFCTLYPSVPVLVTSREVGYEQAPLDEERFEIFRLAPFSEDQVQEYAKKWFDVAAELPSEQQKQKLASFLEESSMVPDLRSNPLMLALLCNIYREENYIPKNRPDVYEKCANMLFERWDRSRGIQIDLPYEIHLRPTMMYLAYWIYASEELRGGVTEEKLIAKTKEYLCKKIFEDEALMVAREFIEFCKGRAWVFTNMGSTKQGEELFQFTHQTFLEYFCASYLCRLHSTPAKLMNVLRTRILKREWDVVAQLAFQVQNKNVEGAGDRLLSALIKQTYLTEGVGRWNLLSFAVRCLEFMIPSPSVIQEISLACVEHSLNWGPMQRKKPSSKQSHSRTDEITVEDIIGQLLSAAIDNRRTIAFNIENILIEKSRDPSDPATILALEIGLHLSTYVSHLRITGIRSRVNKIQDELIDFWEGVSDRLFDICIHQLEILWKKHYRFCYLLLIKGKLSISEIIIWYGVKGILEEMYCTMLPRTTWISIAGQLMLYITPLNTFKPLETSKRINIIKELGIILPTLPTPWLKQLSTNIDLYPLVMLFNSTRSDKNSEKVMYHDSELLFGIVIVLSILVEANQEAGMRNIEFGTKGTASKDSIEMIMISTHPIFKYLRWILTARYLSPELELGITLSISDKVQAEMDNNNFTIEQQNFIWRWVRREIEFIQKTPSN